MIVFSLMSCSCSGPSKHFRIENQRAIKSPKTILHSSQHLTCLEFAYQPMAIVDTMIVVPWTNRAKIDKEYPRVFANWTLPKIKRMIVNVSPRTKRANRLRDTVMDSRIGCRKMQSARIVGWLFVSAISNDSPKAMSLSSPSKPRVRFVRSQFWEASMTDQCLDIVTKLRNLRLFLLAMIFPLATRYFQMESRGATPTPDPMTRICLYSK